MFDKIEFFICAVVLMQSVDTLIIVTRVAIINKGFNNIEKILETPFVSHIVGECQFRLIIYQVVLIPSILTWVFKMISHFIKWELN